jgi:hypothetical protein
MGTLGDVRVFFSVAKRWDGRLVATTGCIESMQSTLIIDSVGFTDGAVRFETKRVHLVYEGKLAADGKTIEGTMALSRRVRPVTLTKVDVVPGPNRPQTPHGPFPYEERQVHYRNDAANIVLAGTLTLPRTGGPFPAVLLIPGSGPADRNEEFAFHRPFAVIADYLTRRGIAVLRVDKRGSGESDGDFTVCSVKEFAGDALAGVKYLSGLPEIDPKRIGLVGHSEGGNVAPMLATECADVSFAVLLAGTGVNGYDLMVMQDGSEALAAGATEKQAALIRAWSARYYAVVRDTDDKAEARKKLQELKSARTPEEREAYKIIGDVGTLNIDTALDPGFREDLRFDPVVYLTKVKCPLLALAGEKDCQVPAEPNAKAFEEAFARGGNKDAKVVKLPGLNHLFQHCRTGSEEEYDKIEETISPDVLKLVGDWIEAHTKK